MQPQQPQPKQIQPQHRCRRPRSQCKPCITQTRCFSTPPSDLGKSINCPSLMTRRFTLQWFVRNLLHMAWCKGLRRECPEARFPREVPGPSPGMSSNGGTIAPITAAAARCCLVRHASACCAVCVCARLRGWRSGSMAGMLWALRALGRASAARSAAARAPHRLFGACVRHRYAFDARVGAWCKVGPTEPSVQ